MTSRKAPQSVAEIVCVGAACVDRIFRTNETALAGTSNPADCTLSFGGVARNVAENLARLGSEVSLCSVVGDDDDAGKLLEHLIAAGVDVSSVIMSHAYATPQYAAIVGPEGELFAGASDMRAVEALTIADLDRWLAASADAAWIFLDCNLPAELLATCIDRRNSSLWKLAIDGTSVVKVRRLPQDLSNLDLLFVNEAESVALAGRARCTIASRGVAGVLVIPSEEGTLAPTDVGGRASRPCLAFPAALASPVDTTGAGDALIAGTLHALLQGANIESAVRAGMLLAARAVETHGAVPTLR